MIQCQHPFEGPYDTRRMAPDAHSRPDWSDIDTVCLDLDGTLLDQAYDNHIWRDLVPQRFAVANALELHAAYAEIARRFAERSGTLDWYCIEYWSRNLGIDIGALHREVRSHVAWLPGAREFLARMRAAGKRLLLLTNSHPVALAVKHEQTGVLDLLDASVTSHEFGFPKEDARFWRAAVAHFDIRAGAQPVRRRQLADARGRECRGDSLGVRRAPLGHEGFAARTPRSSLRRLGRRPVTISRRGVAFRRRHCRCDVGGRRARRCRQGDVGRHVHRRLRHHGGAPASDHLPDPTPCTPAA